MSLLEAQLDEIFRVLGFVREKLLESLCIRVLKAGSLDVVAGCCREDVLREVAYT